MMPYRKVSEDTDDTSIISFFNELSKASPKDGKAVSPGLSKVVDGYIPEENEFVKAVGQLYKNIITRALVEVRKTKGWKDMDQSTKSDLRAKALEQAKLGFVGQLHKAVDHLRGMVTKSTDKEHGALSGRSEELKKDIMFLNKIVEDKSKYLDQLHKDPDKAVKVLDVSKKSTSDKIKLPDGDVIEIKHSPRFIDSLKTNKVVNEEREQAISNQKALLRKELSDEPEKLKVELNRLDSIKTDEPEVEYWIKVLKGDSEHKDDSSSSRKEYSKIINYVIGFMRHDLEEINKHLDIIKDEYDKLNKSVQVPSGTRPSEVPESRKPIEMKAYKWLLSPSYANVLTKNLVDMVKDELGGFKKVDEKTFMGPSTDKADPHYRKDIYRVQEKYSASFIQDWVDRNITPLNDEEKKKKSPTQDWIDKNIAPLNDSEKELLLKTDAVGTFSTPTDELPSKLEQLRKDVNFKDVPRAIDRKLTPPGTSPITPIQKSKPDDKIPGKKFEKTRGLTDELVKLHADSKKYSSALKHFLGYGEEKNEEIKNTLVAERDIHRVLDFIGRRKKDGGGTDPLENYRLWLLKLRSKLSNKQFGDLFNWSEQKGFSTSDGELETELVPYRERTKRFFSEIEDKDKANTALFFKEWGSVIDASKSLKKDISSVTNLLKNLMNDETFKLDRYKKVRAPFMPYTRKHAGDRESFEKYYNTCKESIEDVIQFIDSKLITTMDDLGNEIKRPWTAEEVESIKADGIRLEEYLEEFGKKVDKMDKDVNRYFTKIKEFHIKVMDTSAFKIPSKTDEKGESEKKKEEDKEEESWLTIKSSDVLRKLAFQMDLMDIMQRVGYNVLRSDFTKIAPQLYNYGKNPNIFYDYFVKSYPAEQHIKLLKEKSLNGGLDPAQFKEMLKETQGSFDKQMDYIFESADKVIKERSDELKEKEDIISKSQESLSEMEGKFSKEYRELLNVAKKIPALDQGRKDALNKLDEEETKTSKKLHKMLDDESADEGSINKVIKDLGNIKRDFMDTLEEIGKAELSTGEKTTVERLSQSLSRDWVDFDSNIAKVRSRMRDAYKDIDDLNKRIITLKKITSSSEAWEKARKKSWRLWVEEMWNVMDEHWMRKVQDFQAKHNSNFKDYIGIHNEVKKLVGGPVNSRFYSRMLNEIKKQMSKQPKGHPIPGDLKWMIEEIKDMRDVPDYETPPDTDYIVPEVEKENVVHAPEVKHTMKPKGSSDELYDYPTRMSYNVCASSIEFMGNESYLELLLR
jgi:hypothetical protein